LASALALAFARVHLLERFRKRGTVMVLTLLMRLGSQLTEAARQARRGWRPASFWSGAVEIPMSCREAGAFSAFVLAADLAGTPRPPRTVADELAEARAVRGA
jgi:hypothetical protein